MLLICCDRMKLRNLKASFVFKQPIKTSKKVLNFIIRHAPFTFTIYHHSPCLVNVTGVKSLNQLTLAQETIERKLQQQVDKIRIDNTFYSQKNFANVDLRKVYAFMKKSDTFTVEYHIELFAGMYFHPKKEHYPTILFFRTGSYTMMGRTEPNILKECEMFVISLIKKFDKQVESSSNMV